MKNIITTALLCAAAVSANAAWTTTHQTTIWEDSSKYEYSEGTTVQLMSNNGGQHFWDSRGQSTELKLDCNSGVVVDFTQDARYEISFQVRYLGTLNNGAFPFCNLTLVSSGDDVSLLFGNSTTTTCQFGAILGSDVTKTSKIESLANGSCGKTVWSTGWSGPVASGNTYTYKLIFETFSDDNIKDKIYYGVSSGNQTSSFLILNSGHIGMGGDTSKIFDDIGFSIQGDSFVSAGGEATTNGAGGVRLMSNSSTFTTWQRSEIPEEQPNVPEPSAFGLLAGLGAIALAASRRRRSR